MLVSDVNKQWHGHAGKGMTCIGKGHSLLWVPPPICSEWPQMAAAAQKPASV